MTLYTPISSKPNQIYTSCYCEENIWHLCDKIKKSNILTENQNPYVIFISNDNKTVPLWSQSSSKTEDGLVIWDYHVILIIKADQDCTVFDLDSNLPYPCDFNSYTQATFKLDDNILEQFHRKFRVIPFEDYLLNFASDRQHMKDDNGQWLQPPPDYPCIQTSKSTNNINDFISMKPNACPGEVVSLEKFNEIFSCDNVNK